MPVRIATKQDIPAVLTIYGHYVETTAYSFEYETPDLTSFTQRFERITARFPFFVYEEDGAVLGYAYADAPFERAAYAWCAEASVYLRPDVRGRGLGRALYDTLEQALKVQGYVVVYAIITTYNEGSIAFHKAMGYTHLADFPACGFKKNRWHGITWMEKRLNSVEMPTQIPRPFPEIVKTYQK